MKLKTSFFNPTVLRKDITRFAPLWGLYSVFMLLFLFLIWADYTDAAQFARNAPEIMIGMGVVNFGYGGLCALLLFGDLFQGKMAGALHAMPLRREGWFLTHLTAGMLFCVGPNLLGTVLASMILQEYCYLAFIWLAVMLLQFIFFFGVGAFAIQCAGNRLGAAAVYGLFNLLAVLIAFLVTTFYEPALYGIKIDWETICKYAPVVGFSTFNYVGVEFDNMYGIARFEGFMGDHWRYLFISVAVGIALLGLAVFLYRKRQMESAGDFIAVKPVAPVFHIIYTLCVGAVLYFIADQIGSGLEYLFLIIGFAVGVFTGSMLLEKKVNVFGLKKWLLLGGLTVVFFLTVAVTAMDPIGITRYVPEIDQVKNVQISSYPSDYYFEYRAYTLTETEDIQNILDIHQKQVTERKDGDLLLRLRYNLKPVGTVERQYYIDPMSAEGQQIKQYYSQFSFVTGAESVEAVLRQNPIIEYYSHYDDQKSLSYGGYGKENSGYQQGENWLTINKVMVQELLEAVQKDCEEGNMAQNWDFHGGKDSMGTINIAYFTGNYQTNYADITVYSDCVNTIVCLRKIAAESEALFLTPHSSPNVTPGG